MNRKSAVLTEPNVHTDQSDEWLDVWEHQEGVEFLETIGLHPGERVLDFGAGSGRYALPAAVVVGEDGVVYAVDTDRNRLHIIRNKAIHRGIRSIVPLLVNGRLPIPLRDASLDALLAYDVMHLVEDRMAYYLEFRRLLRSGGLFSVYPKHCQDDLPWGSLADRTLRQVREEIEQSGFRLQSIHRKRLCHDEQPALGFVLNFRKDL